LYISGADVNITFSIKLYKGQEMSIIFSSFYLNHFNISQQSTYQPVHRPMDISGGVYLIPALINGCYRYSLPTSYTYQ